jgi:hypothetical protein
MHRGNHLYFDFRDILAVSCALLAGSELFPRTTDMRTFQNSVKSKFAEITFYTLG